MKLGLIVGATVIFALIALVLLFLKRGYVSGPWGFMSASVETPLHRANQDQFRQVIELFLAGNHFDMLYVSREDDRYGGVMLTSVREEPKLSVNFYTHREQKKIEAFRSAMKKAGYTAEENSDSFNGGWGEENRETDFEFTLPKTTEGSVRLVRVALGEVQPGPTGDYFVSASRFSDGPGGRSGIGILSNLDPLEHLFNG